MLQLIITATLIITGIITVEESKKTNSSCRATPCMVTIHQSEKMDHFKTKKIHFDEKKMNQKNENEKATI
ncbi:MAG: hypothetical protein EOO46_25345 [Flavobacterium sp.]|nr:MAG: hypothetical protein EOO46_25345 [Flavobacterium sp.]